MILARQEMLFKKIEAAPLDLGELYLHFFFFFLLKNTDFFPDLVRSPKLHENLDVGGK